MKWYMSLVFFLISFQLFGMQFVPIEMETQLSESDAVLHGVYQSSNVKKMPDNFIATSHYFHLLSIAGINQNEIYNIDHFEVYTPGGTYNGRNVQVSGSPTFNKGEEVVLLLKKNKYGWTVQNFALGKYTVTWDNNQKVIKSSVFPRHPRLGQMPLTYFSSLVIDQLGQALVKPSPDRYVHKENSNNKNSLRSPASVEEEVSSASQSQSDLIWLALLLGIMGSLMTWYHQRSTDEEY